MSRSTRTTARAGKHAVSDISWFQGTLEEAFTRHAPKPITVALLHF